MEPEQVAPETDEAAIDESQEALEAERPLPDLLLLPAYDASRRSKQLERIATQADAHCRKGFELAGRGAYFSARAEFVLALRLLAQGLDAEYRTKAHSRTLAAGWTALAEAEDFIPDASNLEAEIDVPGIIRRHRTPVLQDADCKDLTTLDAVESYLSFAQEQLAFAAGSEVAGSMALYGLGKLHNTLAREETPNVRVARSKALVFCQAALLACPRNYMASNELGITLARAGRFEDARGALEHSVGIYSQPTGWKNLSEVYSRLGQSDAAQRALKTAEAMRSAGASPRASRPNAPSGLVRWVDPNTFAKAAGQTLPPRPPAPPAASPANPPQRQAAGWLPWKMFDARK